MTDPLTIALTDIAARRESGTVRDCPRCHGRGGDSRGPCDRCRASGVVDIQPKRVVQPTLWGVDRG